MSRARSIAALAAAAALAGCGATPPQAPRQEAKKLDAATSGISTTCGLTTQATAFPGDHKADLATLEHNAMIKIRKLESVYSRNPKWIYQGETIRELVADSVTMLRGCGLRKAADALVHATHTPSK